MKNPINIFKISQLYRYLELGNTVDYQGQKLGLTDDGKIGMEGTRYDIRTGITEDILFNCSYYTVRELQDVVDSFDDSEWWGKIVFTLALSTDRGYYNG